MKVTIETAKVYKFRGDKEGPHPLAWAVITIRQWKGGGSIDAQSDYGNYAYTWGAIGERDFREFLCGLGYSYFMGKAHHTRGYRVDWEETGLYFKRRLLESRREGMDAEKAREIFDALEAIDKDEGFFWNARDYRGLGRFLSDHEHHTAEVPDGNCNGFWTVIWPHACATWKAELAAEAAPPEPQTLSEGGATA